MDNDREETLSFSDLLFSSDDDDDDDSKVLNTHDHENQNSIIFNQDFSGFFSEEWSNPISPDHIIFCGKLIPTSRNTQQIPNPINKTDFKNNNNNSSSSLCRCNSDSFSNAHSSSSFDSVSKSSIAVSGRKKRDRYKDDVLASQLACCSKSRWQVFLFGSGSGRFPRNMELSEIKSRQLQRIPSAMSMEKGGGKRLSWLIRILGCGGGFNFDDTIKVSSLGYVRSFDRRM